MQNIDPYVIAGDIDPLKGWYGNRQLFEQIAYALVGDFIPFYNAATAAEKKEILASAPDWVGGMFQHYHQTYGWDFRNMSSETERYFLYVYGASKARSVLTGRLQLVLN